MVKRVDQIRERQMIMGGVREWKQRVVMHNNVERIKIEEGRRVMRIVVGQWRCKVERKKDIKERLTRLV